MNEITFPELKERLRDVEEITLIELLNIRSEDIVEKFSEEIEEQQDKLKDYLNDE
jgi:hypothetical protein